MIDHWSLSANKWDEIFEMEALTMNAKEKERATDAIPWSPRLTTTRLVLHFDPQMKMIDHEYKSECDWLRRAFNWNGNCCTLFSHSITHWDCKTSTPSCTLRNRKKGEMNSSDDRGSGMAHEVQRRSTRKNSEAGDGKFWWKKSFKLMQFASLGLCESE